MSTTNANQRKLGLILMACGPVIAVLGLVMVYLLELDPILLTVTLAVGGLDLILGLVFYIRGS